jgi:hypothetical protein
MADWARQQGGQWFTSSNFAAASDYWTATLQGGTPAVTEGSWTEVIASTPHDAIGLIFQQIGANNAFYASVDIGIGGSGSEQVLVADILSSGARTGSVVEMLYLPIAVPAGSRLSARIAVNQALEFSNCSLILVSGAGAGVVGLGHSCTLGGTGAAGTLVDPGGTANTKGSWVELSAGTPFRIQQAILQWNARGNSAMSLASIRIDIGIGASGSEVVLIPNLVSRADATSDEFMVRAIGPLPLDIPAGTRVSARTQSTITDATDRRVFLSMLGFG